MIFRNNHVSTVILGTMQDGGLPHIGCSCAVCAAAYNDPRKERFAACLAIVDKRRKHPRVWMIDATPDIKWQLRLLANELGEHPERKGRVRQPDGLFLTHAHMGHIGGVPQLGPEAMAVKNLPVYGTAELVALLQSTRLWQPVVAGFELNSLTAGKAVSLAPDLSITALTVPHRDEWGVGTVAYVIHGPQRSILYLPDIDAWDLWPEANSVVSDVDIAIVDASFYSTKELGGRDPVAHPLVPETLQRFANIPGQLMLTHFNHTNPVLDDHSSERKAVLSSGAVLASRGMIFQI